MRYAIKGDESGTIWLMRARVDNTELAFEWTSQKSERLLVYSRDVAKAWLAGARSFCEGLENIRIVRVRDAFGR